MREDTRTLVFAAGTCLVVSLLLSVTAAALKPAQVANEKLDVKKNIIKAFGIDLSNKAEWTPEKIEETFATYIADASSDGLLVYTWTDEGSDTPSKYAFPISGKGLWGDIYGYLALQSDLETIAGISFYKHVETPGLGAEIEKPWFQNDFKGKKLYDDGVPTEFKVVKPGAEKDDSSVDGISGATLTGKGVQAFIRKDAATYAEYFNTLKEGK
ncbi:NADH:ubiquinone reductase (Na(+)-transporting) subunit C [Verrucomicrobia bacterium S94]|nr:NADH:ubiquinone reductase (Na(+)-transporting) subunit C [Verrucomicrobia bacterium S94]